MPDWIASHQHAFAFLGGVTIALFCDQLKSGVVIPCRYEPGLQRTYEEFAQQFRRSAQRAEGYWVMACRSESA